MEQELTRATVDPKYTWDTTRIYESDEAWEKAVESVKVQGDEFAAMAGTLGQGKEVILKALTAYTKMYEQVSGIYTYAMMKQNEDTTVGTYQAMLGRAASLLAEIGAKTAFATPELLSLPEGTLEALIEDPEFADYDAMLKGILRQKPHTLSAREEQLLAMAGEVCGATQ